MTLYRTHKPIQMPIKMPLTTPKTNSYTVRVKAVNEIYDRHVKSGMSNRDIWLRYIYPQYGISERTLYNYLKRSAYI